MTINTIFSHHFHNVYSSLYFIELDQPLDLRIDMKPEPNEYLDSMNIFDNTTESKFSDI